MQEHALGKGRLLRLIGAARDLVISLAGDLNIAHQNLSSLSCGYRCAGGLS